MSPTWKTALAVIGSAVALGMASPASAQVEIKMTGPTINDALHEWMKTYAARLDKAAPGKFKGSVYPASQLGSIPRMVEGMQLGTIEVALLPPEFNRRFAALADWERHSLTAALLRAAELCGEMD